LTREVLHAEVLHDTDTEAMAKLFTVIRDSGVTVKGIISDGQKSIRKAKDQVFPQVPYQLCTYHYMEDLGKPVGNQDLALRKE
jgi:transposase-like protein